MERRRGSAEMTRAWNEKDRGLHRRSPWLWAVREYQKTPSHVLKSLMNEEKQVAAMWVGQRAAEERWRGPKLGQEFSRRWWWKGLRAVTMAV